MQVHRPHRLHDQLAGVLEVPLGQRDPGRPAVLAVLRLVPPQAVRVVRLQQHPAVRAEQFRRRAGRVLQREQGVVELAEVAVAHLVQGRAAAQERGDRGLGPVPDGAGQRRVGRPQPQPDVRPLQPVVDEEVTGQQAVRGQLLDQRADALHQQRLRVRRVEDVHGQPLPRPGSGRVDRGWPGPGWADRGRAGQRWAGRGGHGFLRWVWTASSATCPPPAERTCRCSSRGSISVSTTWSTVDLSRPSNAVSDR